MLNLVFGTKVSFNIAVIRCQGKLEVIAVAALIKLIKMGKDAGGIFCPEYDTVNNIGGEWDSRELGVVHRIAGEDKAFTDALHEPVCEVAGDIGSTGG